MAAKYAEKFLSMVLSFVLVMTSSQILYGHQSQSSTPVADTGNPTKPLR